MERPIEHMRVSVWIDRLQPKAPVAQDQ